MYYHSLHREQKHLCWCRHSLHASITKEILKRPIKDCFKINGKQTIKMSKKGEYVNFKDFEGKIRLPFIIYADFESILVPGDNENLNLNESYTSKYEKYVACSYHYKLVCDDDQVSKHFKSYLSENAVYNFISSMRKESKCFSDVMKTYF